MKKIIIGGIFTIGLLISGCGGNSTGSEAVSTETMTEPMYETHNIITDESDSQKETKDGYLEIKVSDVKIYVPYIENKIPGVAYLEDNYEYANESKLLDSYRRINKPDGTSESILKAGHEMNFAHIPAPEVADYEEFSHDTSCMSQAFSDYANTNSESPEGGLVQKYEMATYDIQAISVCLYEDFYESVPQLTISVYGITDELWNKYLGSEDYYSSNQKADMFADLKKSNYEQCDKIAEKKISESGIYYMDFTEYNQIKDYKQYIVVCNMDEYDSEYGFFIKSAFNYDISDINVYNKWKDDNKNKYIG